MNGTRLAQTLVLATVLSQAGCASELGAEEGAPGSITAALTNGATAEIQLGATAGSDWWPGTEVTHQTFIPRTAASVRYVNVCFYQHDAATRARIFTATGTLIATSTSVTNTGEACGWQNPGYEGRFFKFVFGSGTSPLTANATYSFGVDGGGQYGYGAIITYPSQYPDGHIVANSNVPVPHFDMIGTIGYAPGACTNQCVPGPSNTTGWLNCAAYSNNLPACPGVGGAGYGMVCRVECVP